MIKLSDRLGMFWRHRGSAIRCFVLLIVLHNLLYTLKSVEQLVLFSPEYSHSVLARQKKSREMK